MKDKAIRPISKYRINQIKHNLGALDLFGQEHFIFAENGAAEINNLGTGGIISALNKIAKGDIIVKDSRQSQSHDTLQRCFEAFLAELGCIRDSSNTWSSKPISVLMA